MKPKVGSSDRSISDKTLARQTKGRKIQMFKLRNKSGISLQTL